MRINRLQIENFRSIRHMDETWDKDLNIFVGPNNAGKSSILQALAVVQAVWGSGPSALWGCPSSEIVTTGASECRIGVHMTANQGDCVAFRDTPWQQPGDAGTDVEVRVVLGPGGQWYLDRLAIDTMVLACAPMATEAWSVTQRPFLLTSGNPTQLSPPLSQSVRNPVYAYVKPLEILGSAIYRYDPFRRIAGRAAVGGSQTLSASGTEFTRIVAAWKQAEDPRFAELEALLTTMVPDLGRIVFLRDTDACETLAFRRADQTTVTFEQSGTGIGQLLLLLFKLVSRDSSVLLIEEPEMHLHPSAQRVLFQKIRQVSPDVQMFIATHSPLFVDRINVQHNFVVGNSHEQGTMLKQGTPDTSFSAIQEALGLTLGDTLFGADVILLVPGPSDMAFIRELSRRNPTGRMPPPPIERVHMVPLREHRLHILLAVLSGLRTPVLVQLDRSPNEDAAIRKAIEGEWIRPDQVLWIRPEADKASYELEDTLSGSLYLESVNTLYDLTLTESDLNQARERLSTKIAGRRPTTSRLYLEVLRELGKLGSGPGLRQDLNKEELAADVARSMDKTNVPDWYDVLWDRIDDVLGTL